MGKGNGVPPQPPLLVKKGDVVYFRKCKKSSKAKSVEVGFKGNGFGVFLGHVPLFAPDPPALLIFQMLGQIGFISLDDVKAFLGDDAKFQEICDKFTDKYWGRKNEDIQKEAAARAETQRLRKTQETGPGDGPKPLAPVLVDSSGRPLGKDTQ